MNNLIFIALLLNNSTQKYFVVTIVVVIVIALLFIFIMAGLYTGKNIIYRKTYVDREKIELRFNIYDKEWLKNLNIKIVQIISTKDSIPLRLYILYPKKFKNRVVIFHHGITSSHVAGYKHAKYYLKAGFIFICYDSRGWGDNKYNGYCTYGIFEKYDLLDVIKYVKSKYKFKNIILHGESNGGKTCLDYATKFDYLKYVDGYIIDSGFVSLKNVVRQNIKRTFPWSPIWLMFPGASFYFWFKTKKTIGQNDITQNLKYIQSPVFVIHSVTDVMAPFTEFQSILKNIPNLTYYTTIDSPHCLTSVFHRPEYIKKILDFVNNKVYAKNKKNK